MTIYDLLTTQGESIAETVAILHERVNADADRALWLADGNLILEALPMDMVFAVGYLAGREGQPPALPQDKIDNE